MRRTIVLAIATAASTVVSAWPFRETGNKEDKQDYHKHSRCDKVCNIIVPAHAHSVCVDGHWNWQCDNGYRRRHKRCVPATCRPQQTTIISSPSYASTPHMSATSAASAFSSALSSMVSSANMSLTALPIATSTVVGSLSQTASVTSVVASSSTIGTPSVVIPSPTAAAPTKTAVLGPQQIDLDPHFEITDKAQDRHFYWTIEEMWAAPDGLERLSFVVNGQIEGPLIEANKGDTIYVHVQNLLTTGTALHWHGLSQNGSVWADGPTGVTQCPIPAGHNFTYIFQLNREDQAGTFWWHAHRAAQYADGLTGPLVVHATNDPLKRGQDYDIDTILMVRDQFHDLSAIIVDGLRSPEGYNGSVAAPSPKSGLINGHGVYNCSAAPPNSKCTQRTIPELHFPPNKRVRLRIINQGTHALFKVSVDEHELNIIEVDDTATLESPPVHRVAINIAQRYSAVFNTSNDVSGDSFFLRAQMNTGCFAAPLYELDPQALATVRIVEEGDVPCDDIPESIDWADEVDGPCVDLDESLLVPRIAVDAPSFVNRRGVFNSSIMVSDEGLRFALNEVPFEAFTHDPLLFKVARGEMIPQSVIANVVSEEVEVVDIILNNISPNADHPFHLHLIKGFIVARGNGTWSPDANANVTYNTVNPLRRDTYNISPGSFLVVRIVTDIPGVAAFHCHIAWHQAQGLFGAVIMQPQAVRANNEIPSEAFALCDPSNYIPGTNVNTTEPARRRLLRRNLIDAF